MATAAAVASTELRLDLDTTKEGQGLTGRRRSSGASNSELHVGFDTPPSEKTGVQADENSNSSSGGGSGHGRLLTAKYPKHQMGLVRRRIELEDWIETRLEDFHANEASEENRLELDIDELLQLKTADERTTLIREQLANIPSAESAKDAFVEDLFSKITSLGL